MGYVNLIRKVVGGEGTPAIYTRPLDWLPIPTIATDEQVYYLLYAVFNDGSNHIAFKATGAYTVDWGDGSATENKNTGVQAEHTYTYSSCSDLTVFGYKQALIKITPQAGQNLTGLNIGVNHSLIANWGAVNIIDIVIHSKYFVSWNSYAGNGQYPLLCERFYIMKAANVISAGAIMRSAYNFKQLIVPETTAFSTYVYGFQGNNALQYCPLTTTSNAANLSYLFDDCRALFGAEIDIAGAIYLNYMFRYDYSLKRVRLDNCDDVTACVDLFTNCVSLSEVLLNGMKISFTIQNAKMSGAALDILGQSVADMTGLASPIFTCKGNYGTATMTDSIWTNKNWTLVKS
jgi:hypothetical protein